MSQQEINPLEDWASEELSEAELDALAGGRARARSFASAIPTNPFSPDLSIIRQSDNMFDSYDGVKGSTLDNDFGRNKPMNLSLIFP